jgi:TRAP-type mannitol/chloroaromatic compound transport system substrate-binding protein
VPLPMNIPIRLNKEEAMTQRNPTAITRRKLLLAGAAVPLCAVLSRPAAAAEFTYKLATGQDPTHPVNVRAKEAADRIKEATGGRLEINLFPANQLGSDTDLLTQVRNGSVEFFNLSSLILATLVPAAGIVNLGLPLSELRRGLEGHGWRARRLTSGRRSPRHRS